MTRSAKGTFLKGVSGNPAGRPKSENAVLRQKLAEQADDVMSVVVNAALAGDMQAAKLVLDRVCPPLKPQTAPVHVELPEAGSTESIGQTLIQAVSGGRLPADVALTMAQSLTALARIEEPATDSPPPITRIERVIIEPAEKQQ